MEPCPSVHPTIVRSVSFLFNQSMGAPFEQLGASPIRQNDQCFAQLKALDKTEIWKTLIFQRIDVRRRNDTLGGKQAAHHVDKWTTSISLIIRYFNAAQMRKTVTQSWEKKTHQKKPNRGLLISQQLPNSKFFLSQGYEVKSLIMQTSVERPYGPADGQKCVPQIGAMVGWENWVD